MGMQDHPVLAALYKRRSIRDFTDQPVSLDQLRQIMDAGIWAPSGKNNQPWRFVTITDPRLREQLAQQTLYSHILQGAPALIAVYTDQEAMYDTVKDHQAVGAALQNMLLASEALGLGAVWIGQILKNKAEVSRLLGVAERYDLMAVLALGYPAHRNQRSQRKELDHFILDHIGDEDA